MCMTPADDDEPKKPHSPLAMAAADMLEEEEEEELRAKKPLSPLAMAAADMLEEEEEELRATKPLSPLAMAAADMLEEEDELLAYWDRYDDAKQQPSESKPARVPDYSPPDETTTPASKSARTERLLNTFYAKIGVDKAAEDAHRAEIDAAIVAAREALDRQQPAAALLALSAVDEHLQPKSSLGAAALLELARAYEHTEQEANARRVYELLLDHPIRDVRRQAQSLLASVRSRILRLSAAATGSRWGAPWGPDAWSKRRR